MIGKLKGRLDSVGPDRALIDVGGVCYLVFCSARTLRALPAIGEPAEVLVETHVREDHIHLYGFAEAGERDWFNLLQSVQGVGSKVALALLSALDPLTLAHAIAAQDGVPLTQATGVGTRLAARIVNELKDKVPDLAAFETIDADGAMTGQAGHPATGATADAVSALVHLGYRPAEAAGAVSAAVRKHGGATDDDVATLVRHGLQELNR